MTEHVILLWPLTLEQRLRLAISALLAPVSPDRISTMMPDQCGRMKSDLPALLLDAPAEIDVITCHPVRRIISVNRNQTGAPVGAVATGNVLRFGIGKQD